MANSDGIERCKTGRRTAAKAVAETEFGETMQSDVQVVSMMFCKLFSTSGGQDETVHKPS